MERRQVSLYLVALVIGATIGLTVPWVSYPAEFAISPALALLLYATFLGVPFAKITEAFTSWHFLITVLVLNFIIVPTVVYVLSRIVAHDQVLLVGVLFVLLTPCIDYVIVFAGLAGGSKDKLLAATPLLMLAQMLLLPFFFWLFLGNGFVERLDFQPFVSAFFLLIIVPLAAAIGTQFAARRNEWGKSLRTIMTGAMVPLMMLTLAVVVASQIRGVSTQLGALLLAVLVYVVFAVLLVPIGALTGRIARLSLPDRRAVVFSGTTRNSLVVLPLVLALPAGFELAPLVVVSQTLIELVAMVVLIRLIPQFIKQ